MPDPDQNFVPIKQYSAYNTQLDYVIRLFGNTSAQQPKIEFLFGKHIILARSPRGTKPFSDCADYGAFVFDKYGNFKAAIIADGVSSLCNSKFAAYHTVHQLAQHIQNLNQEFSRVHAINLVSALIQHPDLDISNLKSYLATTFTCAVYEQNKLHIFGFGDSPELLYGQNEIKMKICAANTKTPNSLVYTPTGVKLVAYERNNEDSKPFFATPNAIEYCSTDVSKNDILLLYTDGINKLFNNSNDLDQILRNTPCSPKGIVDLLNSISCQPTPPDDTTLAMVIL
jgi:serine/threonine protein phosphatase PrpC